MGLSLIAILGLLLAAWFAAASFKGDPAVLKARARMVGGSIALGVGVSLIASGRIAPGIVLISQVHGDSAGLTGFHRLMRIAGVPAGVNTLMRTGNARQQARPLRPGAMSDKGGLRDPGP